MNTEKTLVLLKPSVIKRSIIGEIITRFERKGLRIVGMKMIQLNDDILAEHYAHLVDKPFFPRIKKAMMATPVIAMAIEGVDAIAVVRQMAGPTNGRVALPGTIRGDYAMSFQENIVHASDAPDTAAAELKRFFNDSEIFAFPRELFANFYATDEY